VTKAEKLAALLLADRDRPETTQNHNIVPCFVCGHAFVYRGRQGELSGRFCSIRCQEWYDQGNPGYERQRELTKVQYRWRDGRPMRPGKEGFYIACKHCNKEFESKGLRCCSKECESAYLESEARKATLKEAGIEPEAKRRCEAPNCDRPIPKWKNGRQVSSKVRFCSPLCRKRANRILDA
jgi:hypothetical protein